MNNTFLSVQASYHSVEVTLFKNNTPIDTIFKADARMSSHLIPIFDEILSKHSITIKNLDFIAIDKGPGAFTSLRAGIATVNGIAFTGKVPLVGVNSLEALLHEAIAFSHAEKITASFNIIGLLNAYSKDFYYILGENLQPNNMTIIEQGCEKMDNILSIFHKSLSQEMVLCIGNGVNLEKNALDEVFRSKKVIYIQQEVPTAKMIGKIALNLFKKMDTHIYKIAPNYIKSQPFATQKVLIT